MLLEERIRRSHWTLAWVIALLLAGACGPRGDNATSPEGPGRALTEGSNFPGASDADRSGAPDADSASTRPGTLLKAELSGHDSGGTFGDPDGSGVASFGVDAQKGEACYEISVANLDQLQGLHLHEGQGGFSTEILLALTAPAGASSTSAGCTKTQSALLQRIEADPTQFYVEVHSEAHPAAALRGTLHK